MIGLGTAPFPGLGQGIGVEAGTYLEITGVYPPPEAEEGDWVFAPVSVRNNHTADVVARLRATIDGITVESYPATLKAGTDYSWGIHFTMPNKSVSGTVEAQHQEADLWYVDDTANIPKIALPGVPPEGVVSWWPAFIALGLTGGVLALIFIGRKEIESGKE